MDKLRLAVTSGYSGSKHAIALLHHLSMLENVEVVLCLEVKTFSYRRIRQLVTMYGMGDAAAKFRNVFLQTPGNRLADETSFISDFLKSGGIVDPTTKQACTRLKIAHLKVNSLNDTASLDWLRKHHIDLVVYSGGGLLATEFIQSPTRGVLNVHSGPLPFFRGMNCLEWTLLYGVQPEITVHLIDRGIDTGPILARFLLEPGKEDTIVRLRGKCVVAEVKALLEVVRNFNRYYEGRITQGPGEGLQFFTMHRFLKEVVEKKIKSGNAWVPFAEFRNKKRQ